MVPSEFEDMGPLRPNLYNLNETVKRPLFICCIALGGTVGRRSILLCQVINMSSFDVLFMA